jgi:hypothetical protein
MIEQELIGRESKAITLKIKLEDVRRFSEAIGIQFNDQGPVPATFVGTLIQAKIPGFELLVPGIIHGEQKITYHRPLYVGDSITYKSRIKDIYQRNGKRGKINYVVVETIGSDLTGEMVFSSSSILIAPTKGEA